MEHKTAADVMTRSVHTVDQNMDVREAIAQFKDLGISGAPVVGDDNLLVGVVSQTDIVNYYLTRDEELVTETDFYERGSLEARQWGGGFEVMDTNVARVKDIMSPVMVSVEEDTPIRQVAGIMMGKQIHRVLVTSGDEVVGILSALDLLKSFYD